MTLLMLIWTVSVVLASSSIFAMLGLLLKRALVAPQQRREAARKEALMGLLLEYLDQPDSIETVKQQIQPADFRYLNAVIEDLARVVRGADRDRLIALLPAVGALDAHIAALHRGRQHERRIAADSLRYFDDPTVIAALKIALIDRSPRVRLAAARSLAEIGAVDTLSQLLDALADSGTSITNLVDIVRKVAGKLAPELRQVLQRDAPELAKALAIDGLASIGDLNLVGLIGDLDRLESDDLKVRALQALSELGDPRAEGAVIQGLSYPRWPVRAAAAACAGAIGIDRSIPSLTRLLADAQWLVRYRAAEALCRLGDRGTQVLKIVRSEPSRAGLIAQSVLSQEGIF